jgi:hypothetical protein
MKITDDLSVEMIRGEWDRGEADKISAREQTTLPADWRMIRQRIIEGDRYHCCVCDSTEKLEVHHRDGNEQNNSTANLVTLCYKCHRKIPVPPFSERFYCRTIVHTWYKPICTRLGRAAGTLGPENCPFHSVKRGCLLVTTGAIASELGPAEIAKGTRLEGMIATSS